MPKACPVIQNRFHQLVNMTAGEIRSWARDSRAKCASFPETRARLPMLANLKAKSRDRWDSGDCQYAQRVISFNSRHIGQMKRFGCTMRETVALRNWGHMPKCPMPPKGCSTRPPKRG
jgi:hypothetical protein